MIAKLYDEISRSWIYYDKISSVKRYAFRSKLVKNASADLSILLAKEIIPETMYCSEKGEGPNVIHMNRLLVRIVKINKDEERTFKVVSLSIQDGPVLVFGYSEGYLISEESGQTIERL